MPWYPVKWGLALGEQDVTKDQLRNRLTQKEEEIRRLRKVEERLMKDAKELEEWNKVFEDKIEQLEKELESLRKRDKIAEEIVREFQALGNCSDTRSIYDLITDWEQAGMSLSR